MVKKFLSESDSTKSFLNIYFVKWFINWRNNKNWQWHKYEDDSTYINDRKKVELVNGSLEYIAERKAELSNPIIIKLFKVVDTRRKEHCSSST